MNFIEVLRAIARPFLPGAANSGNKASSAAGSKVRATRGESGKEQSAEFYDQRFARKARWREHYTKSRYYPVWTVVADRLKRAGARSVVDIGCGPGQLACLLRDQGMPAYVGLDFSPLRLDHARKICPDYEFQVVDIFESDFLATHEYDAVILLEFLEHVERDLEALARIKPGKLVIASVPNFADDGHVRFFETADEVRRRYQSVLPDLSVDTFRGDEAGKLFFLIQGQRT